MINLLAISKNVIIHPTSISSISTVIIAFYILYFSNCSVRKHFSACGRAWSFYIESEPSISIDFEAFKRNSQPDFLLFQSYSISGDSLSGGDVICCSVT